jgi:UDP-N-acetylmuramyl-tripeptide synthetase
MGLFQSVKNIYHLFQAVAANLFFGFPSRKIKIIGVTGTNGKTTTVWMVDKILQEAGFKTAVSSTINFKIGEEEWVNKTKFTTRSAWQTQKFIKQAVKAECDYLVMETSSHALDQNRVWGVVYDVAVITNITREHLDYHGDMESYKNAKLRLFTAIGKNSKSKILNSKQVTNSKPQIRKNGVVIVNLAMDRAEEFLAVEADEKYGYFTETLNYKSEILNKIQTINNKFETVEARNIKSDINGSAFEVRDMKFEIHLPGQFNVENALAAVCAGLSQGINLTICSKALKKIKKVPGRMDYVENDRGLKIIIDYALTPDSMEKLGQLARQIAEKHKIIWVFGACGERDRGKRPIMGAVGAKYADIVIITNEDPYGEDEEDIINQVLSGIVDGTELEDGTNSKFQILNSKSNSKSQKPKNNKKFNKEENGDKVVFKITDRKDAIKKALEMAQEGDVVLVTGKGAEETMAIGKKRIPWNDRKVVEKILKG